METEIELKYLLCSQDSIEEKENISCKITEILILKQLSFTQKQKHLANYYLDTPQLALRKLDVGLRVRGIKVEEQALQFEQTVKTSGQVIGGLHKRPEYNVDIPSTQVDLTLFPKEIWCGKDVKQLEEDIYSLFDTHFTRITWIIELGNSVIELAFDEGSICCEGYDRTESIYELELELVSGEQQGLFSLAKVLFENLSMRPGHLSKAARGYALAAEFKNIKKIEAIQSAKAMLVNGENIPTELRLEVVPMKGITAINGAVKKGIEHSLSLLQTNIDEYIASSELGKLIKIAEILALLRQGFWLFEKELPDEYVTLRKELSFFIGEINWADNAEHIQELISKTGGYRKKIARSEELIDKLKLEKNSFPNAQQVTNLFYSERFNLLQLSLLKLLLKGNITKVPESKNKSIQLVNYAKTKLDSSLNNIMMEMTSLGLQPKEKVCESYMSSHGVLIRSLLAGSWFSALFDDGEKNEMVLSYRRPWLDIKQGISELQTLYILKQQLVNLSQPERKLENWLDSKIDNLLLALEQSRLKAKSIKPYWRT